MQQTEKYKFNLIDPTDEFSPDPLNDNASKLETALNSHESAVQSALDAHQSSVETRLTAQDAAIAKNCLFKLAASTAGSLPGDVTLSLSGVRMADYAALFLVFQTTSGSPALSINDSVACQLKVSYSNVESGGFVLLLPQGPDFIAAYGRYSYHTSSGFVGDSPLGGARMVWTSATSLKLTSVTSATLYGLKK